MGGNRIKSLLSSEVKSALERYRQFEVLVPSGSGGGSGHPGEDGRFVESMLRSTLGQFLPKDIELLSGFVMRAGVQSPSSGSGRRKDEDEHSAQLDIIAYDTAHYPVYQRFENTAVVLPEGVVGIISVKKTLRNGDLVHEFEALRKAAALCAHSKRTAPFIALVGMDDELSDDPIRAFEAVMGAIKRAQSERCVSYDELPNFVGSLRRWSVKKILKPVAKRGDYLFYSHKKGEEHLGVQFILKGIFDVYYSSDRSGQLAPGMVSFTRKRDPDAFDKSIVYKKVAAGRFGP